MKRTRLMWLIVVPALMALCVVLSGCSGTESNLNRLIVTMINNAGQDTNMFITPGEDFDPTNNLAPGESRTWDRRYAQAQATRFITVNAGRGANIIDAALIEADFTNTRLHSYTATFAAGAVTVVQTN